MLAVSILCRAVAIALSSAFLAAFALTPSHAQSSHDLAVTPSAADWAAARHATHLSRHARPAHLDAAPRIAGTLPSHPASAAAPAAAPAGPPLVRYPGDLSYHGGAVVDFTESHAIYLNPNGSCTIASCWGNPEGFLRDLGQSGFIHLVDQYVGLSANNRYTVGRRTRINFQPNPPSGPFASAPFTDDDMLAVVHAVASASDETGYQHIYHVFLPPGTDECLDSTFTVCYSPDNRSSYYFCAYHGSVDFTDIGHVLYSVEPYQNVRGCQVRPGTPNGQLADSTNNVLSHELFEILTDPDGKGWWNSMDNGLYQQEIGDECSFIIPHYFDPSTITLDDHQYAAQLEYDNSQHACTAGR